MFALGVGSGKETGGDMAETTVEVCNGKSRLQGYVQSSLYYRLHICMKSQLRSRSSVQVTKLDTSSTETISQKT